jgi:hypothetical protein
MPLWISPAQTTRDRSPGHTIDTGTEPSDLPGAAPRLEDTSPDGPSPGIVSKRRKAFQAMTLAVTVAALACGGDSDDRTPPAPAASSRDSSGVRVVENTAPRWSAGEEWGVDSTPRLDIGRESPPDSALGKVRAALRMRDGRIVVANAATSQLRFYDSTGRFLNSVGRAGNGPGEFEELWRLRRIADDSLMAMELGGLTSIFAADGRYVRRFRLQPWEGYPNQWWIGRLDGDYLVGLSLARIGTRVAVRNPDRTARPDEEQAAFEMPQRPPGYRDSLMHFLYRMDGSRVDTIGRLASRHVGEATAFALDAAYATVGDRFLHSPGDRIEIREYRLARLDSGFAAGQRAVGTSDSGAGRPRLQLTRIIRVPPPRDLIVTDADRAAYHANRLAELAASGQLADARARAAYEQQPLPVFAPRVPAHDIRMFVDPHAAIWIQHYQIDRDAPMAWSVVDSTGVLLGVVTTPARFAVHEVGADYVLGVWRDANERERVRMYGLRRSRR